MIAKLDPYIPPGADRGVDIFASRDGLGLEEPRIFVEVKHRIKTTIGAPELRSFLGGRKPSDRCLYVSTGGFTKDANYETEHAAVPLTLLDLPALRELLLNHYDSVDSETRQLAPLKTTVLADRVGRVAAWGARGVPTKAQLMLDK